LTVAAAESLHVYRKQGCRSQTEGKEFIVDNKFIDPEKDVQSILDNFYGDQLKTLGSGSEITAARMIIEQHLVSKGSRASVTEQQMSHLVEDELNFYSAANETAFLNKLINARLIKEEFTHLGKTYELGHETLVNSVARYAAENKLLQLNARKFWYGVSLSFSVFLLFCAGGLFYLLNKQSNRISMSLASTYYQQGNHFYAFNIWDNYTSKPFL